MEGSPIDIVIFAPLAPILGVFLFWFLQLLFIESQKFLLIKIKSKHEPFCRFTNFLGILFQTICHALGFTVTKSGISDFYISIHYGKVAPKKKKQGVFEWIANAFLFIGPFFIPATMILACLVFLLPNGFNTNIPSHLTDFQFTFGGQLTMFGTNLYNFSSSFFNFLFNIDFLHPGHFGFMLLLIFLGLGIRPSYIGEKKRDKVDMIYDLRNISNLITHKPLYILILFLFSYVFFYISLFFNENWYVYLFSVFGWLSIISIVALIITHFIILLIKTTDVIDGSKRHIPYFCMPLSYVLMRLLFFYFPSDLTYSLSTFVMILVTIFVSYMLVGNHTNKFKTRVHIKLFRGKKR